MALPLKKRIVMSVFNNYAKTQAKIHKLSYLFWECTLKCNLNCIHCGSDCTKNSSVKDMPSDDFLNVTEKIKSVYDPAKIMIVITGGEPLLRKDLEECGKNLKRQGYPWGCVTNGMVLTQNKFNSLVNSGLRSITLSLDGLKENHNWLRGHKDSFNNAKNALKIISSDKNIVHDVVTCVNKKNIYELEKIREVLIENGIKAWRLFTITPIGRAKTNNELRLNTQEVNYLFEYIKNARKDKRISTSISCEAYTGECETELRDGFFFCRAGINIASVLIDGSISACPNISKNFIQGNIYNDDFLDIWENQFKNMRNRKWMKTGICKKCNHFKFCNGGAMHLRENDKSEIAYCLYHVKNEKAN